MASGSSSIAIDMATELASSLPATMSATASEMVAQEPSGWLGLFGRLILAILNLVSTILYWVIRIATINVPSILYSLLSTSWTVTMNATTLYVNIHPVIGSWILTTSAACSSWQVLSRP